jgi:predicted N-acetyltransferase YhbS
MGLKLPPYEESLGDGLILRSVRDEQDIERYAAFHAMVVSEAEGITCAHLLRHHPEISYEDFLIVEDRRTGEVVSTICLIPWHCRYEDVILDVAMLEMVATHPQYRHRGLVRTQIKRFHEMVSDRNFDLAIIEGIPYYYRQYGYAYACDHWGRDSLPVWYIPDQPADQLHSYRLRQATVEDASILTQLYQDNVARLQLCTLRSLDYWRFLLQWAQYPVWLVEDLNEGQAVGYLCSITLPKLKKNKPGMMVVESGIANHEVGMAVLRQLKTETVGEIQLGWPQTNTLVQIGRSLGSRPLPADQWLLRIPDIARFLSKIGPVLERRIATSDCAGLTADLCLNLFRQAFVLHFKAGKLVKVASVGFVDASMGADGGDLCIPPEAFIRLVFGYRNLDELRDAWPDIIVKPASRYWLETLFPKITSYFWMPYLYWGPTA